MKSLLTALALSCVALPALSQEYTITTTPLDKTLPSSLAQSVVNENTIHAQTIQSVIDGAPTFTRPSVEPSSNDMTWIDSHRPKRKSWHSLPSRVMNTYHLDAQHTVVTEKKLKGFRDARPWPQQHPYKSAVMAVRKKCAFYGPFIDVASGAGNMAMFLIQVIH